jgi:hypothetical protein
MGELNKKEQRLKRLIARNAAIKAEYEALSRKKYKNTRLYSEDAKFSMLADKFYLSERTIEDIVFDRIKYEN